MISQKDKNILRKLAGKWREIAELTEMKARKKRLYNLNSLKPDRSVILCFPEGAWTELLPEKDEQCETEELRGVERMMKMKVYWWEHIHDDNTAEPYLNARWKVDVGDFGVEVKFTHGENRGSYVWEAPIKNLKEDMKKLKFRQLSIDKKGTEDFVSLLNETFGDLLPVRIHSSFWWSMGLTHTAISLLGMESFMMYMYDEPENLHKFMKFLSDEQMNFMKWFEKEGLLALNNRDDYVGSGGVGYTNDLPQKDYKEGNPIRLKDMWGLSESQETVGVSPEMFNEFVLQYQIQLMEKFGLICYGCCEPVHLRMKYLSKIPNLRRVSVSPWTDQKFMAEALKGKAVFSRKPNPAQICAFFNVDLIRKDIRDTLDAAHDCALEIIMKDTHTVQNDPKRITDWVKIALEEAEKYKR